MTALNETADRVKGLDCGADDFLTKPVRDSRLFARVTSLVRMKRLLDQWRMREETTNILDSDQPNGSLAMRDGGSRIILAGGKTVQSEGVKEMLLKDGHDVVIVNGVDEIVSEAAKTAADTIIINHHGDEEASLRMASQLRSLEITRLTPILLAGGEEDVDLLVKAMELGVNDYLSRPIDHQELLARVRTQVRRKRYQDHLHENFLRNMSLALIDSLTGLHNRYYLSTHIDAVMKRMEKNGKPVSLMMIDVDFFKQINDVHGHAAGDEALCEVARRIALNVRGFDMAARYGGDEFVVVMPDTPLKTAALVAERLCQFIAESPITGTDIKEGLKLTVSIGVCEIHGPVLAARDILKYADEALYQAKNQGRNRVVTRTARR